VVVQHLSPEHESILPQLIAGFTRMTAQPALDGTARRAAPRKRSADPVVGGEHHLGVDARPITLTMDRWRSACPLTSSF
jgi:hypothetical protein